MTASSKATDEVAALLATVVEASGPTGQVLEDHLPMPSNSGGLPFVATVSAVLGGMVAFTAAHLLQRRNVNQATLLG